MENASKALLIAGGILFTMLVIGVLIFAWGRFSSFYDKKDELIEIEDISKFNLQFTNYQDRDVYGYEVISLANKIADYNYKHSNDENAKNDEKYNPITIKINIGNDLTKFGYNANNSNEMKLLKFTSYTQNSITNFFSSIIKEIESDEIKYGKENLQKLSKSIGSVFLDESEWSGGIYTEDYINTKKSEAIKKFNSLTKSSYAKDESIKNIIEGIQNYDNSKLDSINKQYNAIKSYFMDVSYKYYEYTQFKKGIFKCEDITDNDYDSVSGRIKEIRFSFTGTIE